jgi:hypothetical protein
MNRLSRISDRCARCRSCACLERFKKVMRFRPGARCVRMCLGFVVTAISAAGCAPVPDSIDADGGLTPDISWSDRR